MVDCIKPCCLRTMPDFPVIVCLCGSTKFMTAFYDTNMRETLNGKIVLSVGMSSHGDCTPTEQQKIALDELHKRKIDLADEVLILNVGGYVGDSTKSEILYALQHDKPIRWLEDAPEWFKTYRDFGNIKPDSTDKAYRDFGGEG